MPDMSRPPNTPQGNTPNADTVSAYLNSKEYQEADNASLPSDEEGLTEPESGDPGPSTSKQQRHDSPSKARSQPTGVNAADGESKRSLVSVPCALFCVHQY